MELDKVNAELAIVAWEDTESGREAVQLMSDAIKVSIDDEIVRMLDDVSVAMAVPQELMVAQGEGEVVFGTLPEIGGGQLITMSGEFPEYTLSDDTSGYLITAAQPIEPGALVIYSDTQQLVVEIKRTGEVTLGKDVDPKFAAHEFWARLAELGWVVEANLEAEKHLAELEEQLEDEQSQRLELQEIVSDIANALEIPQATEYEIADYAAKMKEQLEAALVRLREETPGEKPAEDPRQAYERAMKVVR